MKKVEKQTLIDWYVTEDGKTVAKIQKVKGGGYEVKHKNTTVWTEATFCISFKEAKQYALS